MFPGTAVKQWFSCRRLAGLVAASAGLVVFAVAHEVFPYHTINHDEGVYLQQAAMLLEGQLTLDPPVVASFRPWFFVIDGTSLYPKYSPVPAGMFAVGKLLGGYRIALALIGTAVVWLTYATVAELFDRKTGVLASVLVFASPLFLVEAAVFLPYVPTLAWNLLFAWAYLRADRTGSLGFAAVAGLAIGTAFFARPYTAVLFATPFVAHALWTLRSLERPVLRRHLITATLGLAGVAVTLGYNALVTGSPTVFPYEAFAPRDGLGFGYREILGYSRVYDLPLALEATARNLAQYVTDWSVAPPLGVLLSLGGVGTALARMRDSVEPRTLIVAGLFVTIPVGELYFWGTVNLLGRLSDPSDGLIAYLGPYYHMGLVVPTAAFGAHALVVGGRRLVALAESRDRTMVRAGLAAAVVCASVVGVGLAAGAVDAQLADNREVTDAYRQAYEPFEERDFERALVLLPTPLGDWLNHPLQGLRNDPGYDGGAVYAVQHRQFEVVDAFPERNLYRYTYRGEWAPQIGSRVTPRLRRIRVHRGQELDLSVQAGVPQFGESVSLRASTIQNGYAAAPSPGDALNVTVTFQDGQAVVDSPAFDEPALVPARGRDTLDVRLFVDYASAGSFSYDVAVPFEYRNGTYRALTPRLEVCRNPRLCDGEAAYVPDHHSEGVALNATFTDD
ncbi:MAG: hypothetical protein ACI8XM_002720 [Haloarculaceae archaeon]|jgi:hypothetical protein